MLDDIMSRRRQPGFRSKSCGLSGRFLESIIMLLPNWRVITHPEASPCGTITCVCISLRGGGCILNDIVFNSSPNYNRVQLRPDDSSHMLLQCHSLRRKPGLTHRRTTPFILIISVEMPRFDIRSPGHEMVLPGLSIERLSRLGLLQFVTHIGLHNNSDSYRPILSDSTGHDD